MKRLLALFILVIAFFYLYAAYIGIRGLEVKEYTLDNNIIPDYFDGYTIVHFSDLLYGSTIQLDDVDKLINTINEYNPDIVVFTGNLISDNYNITEEEQENLIDHLKNIKVQNNKYAISSDIDKKNISLFKTIMDESQFKVLDNFNNLIFNDGNNPILIMGIEDFSNVNNLLQTDINPAITIALINDSNNADLLSAYNIDFIFAGGSLGGLLKIPFFGGVIKQANASKYLDGMYNITNNATLYVSSGLGTKSIKLRAFNKPSFNVYRLHNKNDN